MRSQYCGQINKQLLDQEVSIAGWVARRRDHGGVIFIDVRDREGIVQVVVAPDNMQLFALAESLRSEFVVQIKGLVRARPAGTVNAQLPSGEIEINAAEIIILGKSQPLPFPIDDEFHEVGEEMRLKYRYLDLRRPEMFKKFKMRAEVFSYIRQYMEAHGFIDVETPCLTRATPEGARDYLVPSRTKPGSFFALPQSPQQFKQLLMMAGFDRYYQIVRCFRDEDLRADRQPEFTQLDVETSFLSEETIQELMEEMMRGLFAKTLEVALPNPFPRMTYAEAQQKYGSDKPDLRIPLELVDVGDLFKAVDFKVFAQVANNPEGRIAALKVPGGAQLSRKEIDAYTQFVSQFGAKGLAYIKINAPGNEGLQSPILKFIPSEIISELITRLNATIGDIIFFGADQKTIVNEALGALRVRIGHDLKMVESGFKILWVVDFPMFEKSVDKGVTRLSACHHPFTAPKVTDIEEVKKNPADLIARAYDMVLNGTELGGGSIRINTAEMQKAVFNILNIDDQEAEDKFGHLLTAMKLGCPPHGGIAFGLDRIVMLMTGSSSIRDVIAFPKTQTATCPLTEAPATIAPQQLIELGIRVVKQQNDKQEG